MANVFNVKREIGKIISMYNGNIDEIFKHNGEYKYDILFHFMGYDNKYVIIDFYCDNTYYKFSYPLNELDRFNDLRLDYITSYEE